MAEIKPCPFCGRKPKINQNGKTEHTIIGQFVSLCVTFEIKCPKCHASFNGKTYVRIEGHNIIQEGDGYQDCIEQWNKRVEVNDDR